MGLLANLSTKSRNQTPSRVNLVYLNCGACPLECALFQHFFRESKILEGAVQKRVNRGNSMVMTYIDDIVIATKTLEDQMEGLREVFECLC